MIVTLRRFRPFTLSFSRPKATASAPKPQAAAKEPGTFEQFEKMAAHYVDTIFRATSK